MSTRNQWLVLGVSTYLLCLLVTLPASMLLARLNVHGINASSTSGTVWHGNATGLQAGVLNLGNIEWQLRWLPLFTGHVAADVKLTPANGFAEGRVAVSLSGQVTLTNLSATLPLESIVGSGGLPGGWVGTAQARLASLVLKDNWPVAAQGSLDIIDLTGPRNQPMNIGSYRLQFPASGSNATTLIGDLQDSNGAALGVSGTLKLSSGHNYELDTLVSARATTPESIAQGMQILGPPDAQGRRPFSVSGTM